MRTPQLPPPRRWLGFGIGAVIMAVTVSGCGGAAGDGPSPIAFTTRDVATAGVVQHVACVGTKPTPGAPTVVLLSGLGSTAADAWEGVFPTPADTLPARTCTIDRPGLGQSPGRKGDVNSPALNAEEVVAAMDASGEPGPYLFAGWSYGGLVALLAAADVARADPAQLAGLVLIDPTLPDEYRTLDTVGWREGGVALDMAAGEAAAARIDLGDAPVVVLIAGQNTTNVENWSEVVAKQSGTARSSEDFLVIHHPDVGHDITGEDPTTVMAALSAAVAATPSAVNMSGCEGPPAGLGAPLECLLSD